MADALLAGPDAFYSVLAGLMLNSVMALARAAQAGDADQVQAADAKLKPLWEHSNRMAACASCTCSSICWGLAHSNRRAPFLPLILLLETRYWPQLNTYYAYRQARRSEVRFRGQVTTSQATAMGSRLCENPDYGTDRTEIIY